MLKQKPINKGRIQIDSKAKRILSDTQSKSDKLEAMKNDMMSKIDDILLQYKGNDKLIPDIMRNSISTNNQSDIINITDDFPKDMSHPSSAVNLPKIQHKASNKIPKPITKGTNPFMTDVGCVKKTKKQKKPSKKANELIAKSDKEINDLIRNVDEIDTMFSVDPKSMTGSLEFNMRMAKEADEFKRLLRDIDEYKEQIHEEFDEVKYLIKFANNTHKLIDRHKTVISSIFQGAGIKTKTEQRRENSLMRRNDPYGSDEEGPIKEEENDDDDDEDNDYSDRNYSDADNLSNFNGVFNKLKKINQIKDNLSNIQDEYLMYHDNLKTNISNIKKSKGNDTVNPKKD